MAHDPQSLRFLHFGPFEVDSAAGELRKGGAKIRLQDRPFEILKILLERSGEIVTREEFRKRLWPADTFVDFDHSLNASVNKLRQALDDNADNPRLIETVGRRGYRFIGPVKGNGEPIMPPVEKKETAPIESAERPQPSKWLPRRLTIAGAGLAAVAAALLSTIWLVRRTWPTFTEQDSIILIDFENTTGDAIFDGALKKGLAAQLDQSPFLHLVSEDRVRQALRSLGHARKGTLDFPTIRGVCEQVHATAFVTGSIQRSGTHFQVAVTAMNCVSAEKLARAEVEAQSQEQVLKALGQAAQIVRGDLGESLSSIRKYGATVQEASTPSLEALKAYALGDEERARGAEVESIQLFANAVKLDPNFAMAYAQLGAAYNNLGESQKAAEYLKKAFDLRERVSEPEKLYLAVRYYLVVTGEIDQATQGYEFWKQVYPRDWIPYNGLAARYQILGQYDKALENARVALKLAPDNILPYANLASSYLSLNQFAEAKQICDTAIAAKRDSYYTHTVSFEIGFILGDQTAMQRELDWARGISREGDMLTLQAMAEISQGKLLSGRTSFQVGQEHALKEGLAENAAFSTAWEALAEADLGNTSRARDLGRKAMTLGKGIDAQETAAEALALSSDLSKAEELAADLHERFPQHTLLNGVSLPTIRAIIALRQGDPTRAIDLLRPAVTYDFSEFSSLAAVYVRGLAYLDARSGNEAAGEFQKILSHSGIVPTSPRHSLALLGLARAYALAGEKEESRNAFHQFFSVWEHADADVPVLIQAKADFSKLRLQ